ncbi:MAG: hypothetical protein ACRCYB_11885 [Aeromonas veronii]
MTALIAKIETMFNATRNATGDAVFTSGEGEFIVTVDSYMYQLHDGKIESRGSMVGSVKAVERFIALRTA